jgi:MarR family transcriptional regulator, temperature-dependent positive regulator of motility
MAIRKAAKRSGAGGVGPRKASSSKALSSKASSREASSREVFRLSRSPSHLLRRAEQFAAELFARSELHDGVTLRQTVLLAAIAEAEGASQSDLVRTTGVDRSTLAEMMARMEKRGLIARAAAADDGRAKSVRLTADGRRRLAAVLPAIRNVDRSLLAALPAAKRTAFQAILAELADAADEKMSDEAPVKRAQPKPPASGKRPRAKR